MKNYGIGHAIRGYMGLLCRRSIPVFPTNPFIPVIHNPAPNTKHVPIGDQPSDILHVRVHSRPGGEGGGIFAYERTLISVRSQNRSPGIGFFSSRHPEKTCNSQHLQDSCSRLIKPGS